MRLGEKVPLVRECCACSAAMLGNARVVKRDDPVILTLSFTVYRRTPFGRQLGAATKTVYICEPCLDSILGWNSSGSIKAALLGKTVAKAAEARYNAMRDCCSAIEEAS
jgi:hypothetical protein